MNAGLAEMVPVGVFQSDLDGNLTFSNRLCQKIFGIAESDLAGGICVMDYIAPIDQERAKADIRNAAAGKHGSGQEYLLKREDGSIFPALVIGGPVTDPTTCNPAGIRGVIVDLTGRKREAQKLFLSRERLALALSAGESGIWDVDLRNGEIHDIHQWACQTLGYGEGDLLHITTATAAKMIHPVDLPAIVRAYSRHLAGETPLFSCEFRLAAKDGQWKQVAIRGKIIERDPDNKPLRITGIINTISPKKVNPEENAPPRCSPGLRPNAA
jgi:PAS domain S-box-containing protein